MKLCTLRFGNKVYLIESSLQLTLYKIVNKKFKNFRLFPKCCQEVSDSISFILIVAHHLVYNSEKIGSETSWQYIENWHYWVKGVSCWSYSNIFATFPRPTYISYISLDSARQAELNDNLLDPITWLSTSDFIELSRFTCWNYAVVLRLFCILIFAALMRTCTGRFISSLRF